MYQGALARFDKKTESFRIWSLPKTANIDAAQVNMVSPQSSGVDGKVWTQNNGFAGVHRLTCRQVRLRPSSRSKAAQRGAA